jgi:hypothetical protein
MRGFKRTYGPKRVDKKVWKKNKKYTIPKSLQIATTSYKGLLQTQQKSTFIYHEEFTINPSAGGVPAVYIFSVNGLYDPNISGVGHQPRGFDQLMVLYDHYVVIGAKITVNFASTDSAGDSNMCGVTVRDNASTLTTPNDIMEQRYISYGALGGETNGPPISVSFACNPNHFLGRSKPLSDPELKGSSSANPTEQCFFHVFGYPVESGRDSSGIQCQARIEYEAILIEPKMPNSS